MATYLLLRTSEETKNVPARCAAWARRTGADVDVTGPLAVAELRKRLAADHYAGAVLELAPVDDGSVADAVARAAFDVVGVRRGDPTGGPCAVEDACTTTVTGRGTSGFVWALWHLYARHERPPRTLSYGEEPAHVADLRVPESAAPATVVVLLHGGFWRHEWGRDLMDGLALDLTRRGFATWNVEYRRLGPTGGGWPATRDDVVRAVTALTDHAAEGVRVDRVVLLGHSAGAQLALRAAAELAEGGQRPALVVAISGLLDLERAARDGVGWGSVEAFMSGSPDRVPHRYRDATPIANVPLGVPQLLAHGTADEHVPAAQSESYRDRAGAAGDAVELVHLAGADHFVVIDPTSDAWTATVDAVERRLAPS